MGVLPRMWRRNLRQVLPLVIPTQVQ